MTTTIEAVWGSRVMSDGGTGLPGGFLLNNQLTDFSLAPADSDGRPIANRVQPGKRPRSSMSPTLVFDRRTGGLLMSLGSPGGPAIIHFTAKTLVGSLQWGLDVQRAIDLPNFGSFNGPTVLEAGRFPAATVDALKAVGHPVVLTDLPSGLQALQRRPVGWFGGADPRREGVVMGR
jgi:gamma-glutamyltranspeptidase/glutathione hydrolase